MATTVVLIGVLQLTGWASEGLDVRLAFSGAFRTGSYAPIDVRLSQDLRARTGQLRFTHVLGDAWHGEATFELRRSVASAGPAWLSSVLPVYDFTSPLHIAAIDVDGRVLAEETVELRAGARTEPLTLRVGRFPYSIGDDAVAVDASSLPISWWAYEGVGVVWIGRVADGLAIPAWEAIEHWIVAGGSAVVFTGSDLPLIDCEPLQSILPWMSPQVVRLPDGVDVVEGELRPTAAILWTEEPDIQLVRHDLGLGTLYAVTVSAGRCSREILEQIASHVDAAGVPSLVAGTAAALLRTPLQTPGHAAGAAIVIVSIALVAVASYTVRRQRMALLLVVVGAGCAAVCAGLAGNATKRDIDVYTASTVVRVIASVGSEIHCTGMMTLTPTSVALDGVAPPLLASSPRHSVSTYVASRWEVGRGGTVPVGAGEDVYATCLQAMPARISARETGEETLRVVNALDSALEEAFVLRGGSVYHFPQGIGIGEWEIALDEGDPLHGAEFGGSPWRPVADRLGASLLSRLRVSTAGTGTSGFWLVGVNTHQDVESQGSLSRKVSVTEVVLVQGTSEPW